LLKVDLATAQLSVEAYDADGDAHLDIKEMAAAMAMLLGE